MTLNLPRDAEAYAQALHQLLPPGAAWDFPPDGPFAALLLGLAEEFARIDARALQLIDEADPRTTLELLPDWERVAALPDACTGAPDNVGERQAALHQKLTRLGAQNHAAYAELASRIGYQIEIEEHRPARMGLRMGDPLNGPLWAFTWTVHIRPFEGYLEESSFLAVFRMGDRMGTRLRGFGALDVECLIARAAPAHTNVLFAYDIEPTPVLWIDFSQ